jgi:two-component system, OmpR family, response regulator
MMNPSNTLSGRVLEFRDTIRTREPGERIDRSEVGGGAPAPLARILLVDDDSAMRQMIAAFLENHSMRVVSAAGRQEMSRQLTGDEPSLVILDPQLGHEDGLDLLRDVRARSDLPVIIIDYLTKPFGLRELLARIRAVLRRRQITQSCAQRDGERRRCCFGGWRLDRRLRRLTNPEGTPVALTKGEYALLIALVDAPQRPLSREYLMQATRMHEDIFDRSIDVQVLRLRRKLEADPTAPRVIRTERGFGYVFDLPVELY